MESTTKDFNTLVEAKEKITEIATMAVDRSSKLLTIKSSEILYQMAEYLYETLKPHYKENFKTTGYLTGFRLGSNNNAYYGDVGLCRCSEKEIEGGKYFYLWSDCSNHRLYIVFTDDGFSIGNSMATAMDNECSSVINEMAVGVVISIWNKIKEKIESDLSWHYKELIRRSTTLVDTQIQKEQIFDGFIL